MRKARQTGLSKVAPAPGLEPGTRRVWLFKHIAGLVTQPPVTIELSLPAVPQPVPSLHLLRCRHGATHGATRSYRGDT